MANQTVTLEGMQGASSHISTAEGTSNSVRGNVEQELQTLRTTWTGDAANKFQQAGAALISHVDAVNKGLAGLRSAVEQSKQEYSKTHNQTIDGASNANNAVTSVAPYQGLSGL